MENPHAFLLRFRRFLVAEPLFSSIDFSEVVDEPTPVTYEASAAPPAARGRIAGPDVIRGLLSVPLFCTHCGSTQTFTLLDDQKNLSALQSKSTILPKDSVFHLAFECVGCQKSWAHFLLEVNQNPPSITKLGQHPRWSVQLSSADERAMGESTELFKKGRACEAESFGVGASAYYRRCVEGVIDKLLALIEELLDEKERAEYGAALASLKGQARAAEKIECVKGYLPTSLRPGGINPLQVLYSHLSADLHGATDEECLEDAQEVRSVLLTLLQRVHSERQDIKELKASTAKLLGKRRQRDESQD